MIKARTYFVVVFNNEHLSAGVTQMHERLRLSSNWVTPASIGSLLNATTPYILAIVSLRPKI